MFTSGKANVGVYELRACAKALQDVGVKIVAVAIGNNVDEDQLKEISSDEHVIHSQLTGDSAAIIQLISDDVVSAGKSRRKYFCLGLVLFLIKRKDFPKIPAFLGFMGRRIFQWGSTLNRDSQWSVFLLL